MFCNGPEMDGGDTACLEPTTIIEITIPRCQSSSAMTLDDAGGLAGPIKIKIIEKVTVRISSSMRKERQRESKQKYRYGWLRIKRAKIQGVI